MYTTTIANDDQPAAAPDHTGDTATTALGRAIQRARELATGDVLVAGDVGYDSARLAWNRTTDHRPAVIVVAETADDVRLAVELATTCGLGLGVQSTGHGAALEVDGVLVVTSRLDTLTIDPEARTARIGAGVAWGPVLAAAQQHGLAPLLGSSVTVGAVGYTLGGGLGWLARKHGPACDAVRSFEVVTPDGRVVTASPTERSDLFRSLCGGGGGAIAIVTSMEIDLVELTDVYAGNLFFPADLASEVTDAWVRWVADAPEDLSSSIVYMNFPPIPDVPEPLRGNSFTIVRGCWSGDLAEGRAFVDRLRAQVTPVIDLWHDMPFADAATISNDPVDPMPIVSTGGWLDRFDRTAGDLIAASTFPRGGAPVLTFSEVRHVGGGALAAGRRSLSAMGNRDGRFVYLAVGTAVSAGLDAVIEDHLATMKQTLAGCLSERIYLNFVDGAERRSRTADGIADDFRGRLAEVHHWFDPDALLRYGVAAPAAEPTAPTGA